MEKNVANVERWTSLIGGGAALAYALRPRSRSLPLAAALALGGAVLLYRAATGRCPLYEALGLNTAGSPEERSWPLARSRADQRAFRGKWPLPEGARVVGEGEEERDVVEEASRQSFPASDPPGFSPARAG